MTWTYFFHWDEKTLLITVACSIIIISSAVFLIRTKKRSALVSGIIIIAGLVTVAMFTPIKVTVTEHKIIVTKPVGRVTITLDAETKLYRIPNDFLRNSTRIVGIGGLFGYTGKFHNDEIGTYHAYVTESENLILIVCKNRRYVLSSFPETYLKNLQNNTLFQ